MITDMIVRLIPAIMIVEGAHSDTISANGERGILQITEICVQDVNRIVGEQRYVHEDAHDDAKAREICIIYLSHYGGKDATYEKLARIWNGGPKGYKKQTTVKYWELIQNILEEKG
jgi:hypothetical protein